MSNPPPRTHNPHPITPVILSGGAGTRLWPLSTQERPKQFLDLVGESLFKATLRRVARLSGTGPVMVITGGEHLPSVAEALTGAGAPASMLIEPAPRNTGPAVVAAALASDPEVVLLVLPSDHVIQDEEAFVAAAGVGAILARDEGALVTFGVTPSRAETGYGYIEKGEAVDGGFKVARFKEKPDAAEAKQLAADGRHFWNSGMFIFTAGAILEEASRHAPEVLEAVKQSSPPDRSGTIVLGPGFADAPSISIDHAIMERTDRAMVVPLDAGWSDVGSWQSVWEIAERDPEGNVIIGEVIPLGVKDSYVRSESRVIAIAGVEDLVVVETPEVVLIVPRNESQMVRELAARWQASRGNGPVL